MTKKSGKDEKGTPPAKKSRGDGWNNFISAAASGWTNSATGRGIQGIDRNLSTGFAAKSTLAENTLRALYRGDGIGKRIIELPTEAMNSKGFDIIGDPESMVLARLEETGIIKGMENMVRWSQLFGGALGIIGADDAQTYEKPLNEKRLRNIHHIHVYNRWRVQFQTTDLYSDPQNPKFGTPEFYRIFPLFGSPFRVHESRTIRMDGSPVDDMGAWQNNGWGDSVLQCCFDELRQLSGVYDSAESIVDDFITSTITMKGLADLIANDEEGLIIKRLNIMDRARHVTNSRLLDGDSETFAKVASSVSGLPEMMDRFMNKLSSVTGIPVTLLMGQAPAGLNATGDSDLSNWDDKVRGLQIKNMKEPIERLTRLVFLSSDYYFKGQEPENWWVEFRPLRIPSAKQVAELDKSQADTLAVLISNGIISPDEARNLPEIRKRFNLEEYSTADDIAGEIEPTPKELPPPDNAEGDLGKQEAAAAAGETGAPGSKDKTKPAAGDRMDSASAEMVNVCRSLLTGAKGKPRKDAQAYDAQAILLNKGLFGTEERAKAWAIAYGFKIDSMTEMDGAWRFAQRPPEDFSGSPMVMSPVSGVEVSMAKVKNG